MLALGVFALMAAYKACIIPLNFDELFTLFIARLTSLPEIMRAMPVDNQPPLQDILNHISLGLFGESEFALRLPELLAYLAAGLLIYKIVRRHGTVIQALFAISFLLGSGINEMNAVTARPYELLIASTALVFACWQVAAARQVKRLLPLCGVALGLACAILSHHFGVIHAGLLLAAGETVRLMRRRRLDTGMIAAIVVGLTSLVFTVPLAHRSKVLLGDAILHSTNFWAKPSFARVLEYRPMVALPLLCLIAGLIFLPWQEDTATDSAQSLPPVPAYEWAAAVALGLLLPVQILLAAIATNYSLPRYAISTSLGMALLAGWALPRLGRSRIVTESVLALGTIGFLLIVAASLVQAEIRHPHWRVPTDHNAVSSLLLQAPGDLPIVIANAYDYAPEWWYSSPAIQLRLIYLSDLPYAEQQRDFIPELALATGQGYIPMRIADYAPFLTNHSRFLLLSSGKPSLNWVVPRLAGAGWHLTLISISDTDALYQVDRP
jgi:hypothetical protein